MAVELESKGDQYFAANHHITTSRFHQQRVPTDQPQFSELESDVFLALNLLIARQTHAMTLRSLCDVSSPSPCCGQRVSILYLNPEKGNVRISVILHIERRYVMLQSVTN